MLMATIIAAPQIILSLQTIYVSQQNNEVSNVIV